jgi:molybdopterin synthase catalytic subunit
MDFRLSAQPIDAAALRAALPDQRAGACATFEGWVRSRNDGHPVAALEYEAYPALALKEGQRILDEAAAKFEILTARCTQRTGALHPGDLAIWVGVAAEHRGAAFDACRYIIDEVKARVPIWKREHYADGGSAWINSATRGDLTGGNPPS